MKTLSISSCLILMLFASQTSFAEFVESPSNPSNMIEHIVVIGNPEVANFEIFSEKHSERAMKGIIFSIASELEINTENSLASTSI